MRVCPVLSWKHFCLLLLAACLAAGAALPASAQDLPRKQVLVLHNLNQDHPGIAQNDQGLRDVLLGDDRYNIVLSNEYLNVVYFEGTDGYLGEVARYLQVKYSVWKPDIVIITDGALLPLYKKYLRDFFSGTPVVLSKNYDVAVDSETLDDVRVVDGMMSDSDYYNSMTIISRLLPKTKTIYIVIGASRSERYVADRFKKIAKKYNAAADVVFVEHVSHAELLEKIAGVSGDAAILYVRYNRDDQGRSYVPVRVLRDICRVAAVPVFTTSSHLLGSGNVGGFGHDLFQFGQLTGRLVLTILDGRVPSREELDGNRTKEYAFDWRQLERWNIPEARLPEGSRIVHREYGIWEKYRLYVVGGVALVVLESLLVLGLFVNRMRRKNAEAAIVRLNASLEHRVRERTRELWEANVQLYEAAEQLATTNARLDRISRTDSLTGLYNRRHAEEKLAVAYERFWKTGAVFSILMADIDYFKRINDTYGHDVGDALLQHVALVLVESVRKIDTVARWGGEEFLLVLPMTGPEKALDLAERLRGAMAGRPYRYGGGTLRTTLTIGMGAIAAGESLDDLLKRTDEALYRGKEAGRDRVVAA